MTKQLISFLFLILTALTFSQAQDQKATIDIVSQYHQVTNTSQQIIVGVHFKLKPGWHIYWRNPGDSGSPPEFAWNPLPDLRISQPFWPIPKEIPVAHLVNLGYDNEVIFPFEISFKPSTTALSPQIPLDLKINYLVCKEDCIPETAELHHDITIGTQPIVSSWDLPLRDLLSKMPGKRSYQVRGYFNSSSLLFPSPIKQQQPVAFYPYEENLIDLSKTQALNDQRWQVQLLATGLQDYSRLEVVQGILIYPNSEAIEVAINLKNQAAPVSKDTAPTTVALWLLLANAWLGGIILNAMPCVFPIIGIKILQFTQSSNGSRKKLLGHGVAFTGGVLTSMWLLAGSLLALKSAGAGVGWGFQLQSPWFVSFLIVVFSLLSAQMFDLVSFGDRLQSKAGTLDSKAGISGAFWSGALATIIATPCTAPFMGYALGLAATLPTLENLAIFTALGLGMALPYLVLSAFPQALSFVPRPGPWMVTLKKVLAFPLMATVVWLLGVLLQQLGLEAPLVIWLLLAALLLGLGIFLYQELKNTQLALARWLSVSCLILALIISLKSLTPTHSTDKLWEPYSPARVEALRAEGKNIFIDFTAAWCITCQVNKQNVLSAATIQAAFKHYQVHLFRADWTSQDSSITAALNDLNRQGVPVNVLITKQETFIFPTLLTQKMVLTELEKRLGPA